MSAENFKKNTRTTIKAPPGGQSDRVDCVRSPYKLLLVISNNLELELLNSFQVWKFFDIQQIIGLHLEDI